MCLSASPISRTGQVLDRLRSSWRFVTLASSSTVRRRFAHADGSGEAPARSAPPIALQRQRVDPCVPRPGRPLRTSPARPSRRRGPPGSPAQLLPQGIPKWPSADAPNRSARPSSASAGSQRPEAAQTPRHLGSGRSPRRQTSSPISANSRRAERIFLTSLRASWIASAGSVPASPRSWPTASST